jgi:uncharacterized damage-inducible protein DinB
MLRPVGLLYESLDDLERSVRGLPAALAESRPAHLSSIAWTAAHVTQMLDSWIVGRFAGQARHPLLSQPEWATGSIGTAAGWDGIAEAIETVHAAARGFCSSLTPADLLKTPPYDGSIPYLRPTGLNLEYALLRVAAHHFLHTGEITTIRSLLRHPIDDNRDWGKQFL